MFGAGVYDAQRVAEILEAAVYLFYHRIFGVFKVYGYYIAHRAGHLIHKAAGLAEVHVFRVLAYLRYLDVGKLPAAVELVEYAPDQHFVGCGGGKSGSGEDFGLHLSVKASDIVTELRDAGRDAPYKALRAVLLAFYRLKV